jgi:hypothetical protein
VREGTQTVDLTGRGTAPAVTIKPTKLDFGKQPVGIQSKPKTITLTNTGTAPLNVTSIADSGNFVETDNCIGSIAAGASCAINVVFIPMDYGQRKGEIVVADEVGKHKVSLVGTGITAATAGALGGPNTPPFSPIPQSGFGGQNTPPPQALGPTGGRHISAPLIGVAGGGLLFLLLGGFGLFWLTRRRRTWEPGPVPTSAEMPLIAELKSKEIPYGPLGPPAELIPPEPLDEPVESYPEQPAEPFEPVGAPEKATELPPLGPLVEQIPEEEESPVAMGTVIHVAAESEPDRPAVPLLGSLEAFEPPPDLEATREREIVLEELLGPPQTIASERHGAKGEPEPVLVPDAAPPTEPEFDASRAFQVERGGRRWLRKGHREPEPTPGVGSPLLGLIEQQMSELDQKTDKLVQEPDADGEPAEEQPHQQ